MPKILRGLFVAFFKYLNPKIRIFNEKSVCLQKDIFLQKIEK